jgi:isoleucyl-tRNA synthetase
LYKDLNGLTGLETSESVHLSDFPVSDASFIDRKLEHKMQKAQTISPSPLLLRAK